MGEVHLAWDTKYGREVALKFLPAAFTKESDIERFRQESFVLFKLNHPNIVQIYEFEENVDPNTLAGSGYEPNQERVYFIVDEFIPGENLREHMNDKPLGASQALSVASDIAKALKQAHSRGIVHRDIKPDNIMITPDGSAKILDFGLAKLMDWFITEQLNSTNPQQVPTVLTEENGALGTAAYMSPEHWGVIPRDGGKEVDERTDIWSLGIVLFEMLTNKRPFEANTKADLRMLITLSSPNPLSDHLRRGSRRLQRIISKALEKDRQDRYQTIDEMLTDLEKLKHQLDRQSQERIRNALLATAAVIIIVLLFFLLKSAF